MTDIFDQDHNRKRFRVGKTAVILILVGVFFTLASLIYGNENFPMILVMFHINLSTWLIGLGVLVLISERIFDQKLTDRDKRNLVLQLGSPYNRIALEAARQLYALGWHKDGTLKHANLTRANLKGVVLDHAYLSEATLLEIDLRSASLVGAYFGGADLLDANF